MRRFLKEHPGVRRRHRRRGRGGRERRARRGHLHRRGHAEAGGARGRFAGARARATTRRRRWPPRPRAPGEFVMRVPRHARHLGSGGARRERLPRRCADVLDRPGPRLRRRRGPHRRRRPRARRWRMHRTRDMPHAFFSGRAAPWCRACGRGDGAPQDPGLDARRHPHAGTRGAAPRARRPSGLLADRSPAARTRARRLRETAIREVGEETGIDATRSTPLADWSVQQRLRNLSRVAPSLRARASRTIRSMSSACACPGASPCALAPREHLRHRWLPWREAAARVFSWSNRQGDTHASRKDAPLP